MRLNSRGDYGAGVQGDGGVVSVNGIPICGPSAQFGGWIDDDTPLAQLYGGGIGAPHLIHAKTGAVLWSHGANFMRAGGGVWAANDAIGMVASTGFATGDGLYVADVGPDGAIAYVPKANFPVRVHEQNGDDWGLSPNVVEDLQLLGQGRAIWREGFTVRTKGIPVPQFMPAEFYWLRAAFIQDEWWLCYQDGERIVLRPFASKEGYYFHSPLVYRPDLCQLPNGSCRLVWATREGEQPNDVEVRDLTLAEPRKDVTQSPVVTPPIPVPEPPPMPELPASLEFAVAVERNKYPATVQPEDCGKILNAVAWEHRHLGWGLSVKPGGNRVKSPQGVDVAYDILHHKPSDTLWGCFTAPPGGDRKWEIIVNWGQEEHHHSPDRPWLAPIAPTGGTPAPVPTPTPVDLEPLKKKMDDFLHFQRLQQETINQLTSMIASVQMDANALRELLVLVTRDVEALKSKPPSDFDPKQYEARGRVSLPFGLGANVRLPIEKKG